MVDQRTEYDVAVIGLGYIGLPTAALIARSGMRVLGVDVNPVAIETIAAGRIHIEEPDLEDAVREVVATGMLTPAATPAPADIFIIAVPTPFAEGYVPDLSFVMAAIRSIAPVLKRGDTVIIESTSPVGTTDQARDLLVDLRSDLSFPYADRAVEADVALCYCPERVLPGRILIELVENSRSIGGITPHCADRAVAFYRRFVRGECTVTEARTAEMVKLVENAFRDTNIAFANEIGTVCEGLGLDVWNVIALANQHPRVNVLKPGPGVGGHCIAVDPWFIVDADRANTPLIQAARSVNDGKPLRVITQASQALAEAPTARIACLGLAFKADVDDLRESPAKAIALHIAEEYGDRVDIVEPFVDMLPEAFVDTGATLVSLDQALVRCDIVLLLVDHRAFANLDPEAYAGRTIIDTRGLWRH